jgi:hypothetical protein
MNEVGMQDTSQGLSGLDNMITQAQSGAPASDPSGLGLGSLVGHMSTTVICVDLLAGLIGTAYFIYGKKTANFKLLYLGIALCVVPYFIGNTLLLIAACLAMVAAPFVI